MFRAIYNWHWQRGVKRLIKRNLQLQRTTDSGRRTLDTGHWSWRPVNESRETKKWGPNETHLKLHPKMHSSRFTILVRCRAIYVIFAAGLHLHLRLRLHPPPLPAHPFLLSLTLYKARSTHNPPITMGQARNSTFRRHFICATASLFHTSQAEGTKPFHGRAADGNGDPQAGGSKGSQGGTRRLWQRQKGTQKRHKYYGQAANELQEPNINGV